RTVSARRAPGYRAVDGRAPRHARHDADHRQGAAPFRPVVRVRTRAPRPDAGARDRPPDWRDDDRRNAVHRSATVSRRPLLNMFAGKVIAITGASDGIGAELARQVSGKGVWLALAARNLEK